MFWVTGQQTGVKNNLKKEIDKNIKFTLGYWSWQISPLISRYCNCILYISMLKCSFSIFYYFLRSIYYLFRSQSIFYIFTCSILCNNVRSVHSYTYLTITFIMSRKTFQYQTFWIADTLFSNFPGYLHVVENCE